MPVLRQYLTALLFLCITSLSWAAENPVLKFSMTGSFDSNYGKVSSALEDHRFFVIFEPNIGRSIASFEERRGEDYNRNGFENIRSLVFCNPWYVNQVINKDPEMAAICPLSVTLLHKGENTEIMFLRPSLLKPDSPAQTILLELEADISKALKTVAN